MYPRPRPDLKARTIDGETVLLDRAGGSVHQLNATASFIWAKLDGHTSPHDIALAVAEAFEVEPERAVRDVSRVLDQFRTLNILVLDGGGEYGRSQGVETQRH